MIETLTDGDTTVKLCTYWTPISWITWDDYGPPVELPADVVDALNGPHRDHDVWYRASAFGWREIRCHHRTHHRPEPIWQVADQSTCDH